VLFRSERRVDKRQLKAAMGRLFKAEKIRNGSHKRSGRTYSHLEIAD